MLVRKQRILIPFLLLLALACAAPPAAAQTSEYKAVVKHLKTKYQAKKVRIPFLWLARFAVRVVRPAGVKSFNVTLFENLKFSRATLDSEMQAALRSSFSPQWNPVFRARSREGEQVYMYMRESGNSVKIMVVSINKQQAAIVRATFDPEKMVDFISDPNIFGVSLRDKRPAQNAGVPPKPADETDGKGTEIIN